MIIIKKIIKKTKEYKRNIFDMVLKIYKNVKTKMALFINSHKNQHLSRLVKKEKKRMCKPKPLSSNIRFNFYNPSFKSFIFILALFILFFIASHFIQNLAALLLNKYNLDFPFAFITIKQEDNHYQNLIAILAGIGAIVFALTIFIAENFRDSSTDRGRVLLRESQIWPLTLSVIFSFLLLLWGEVNYTIFILVIAVSFFAIYSLAKIISTLLSKHKLAQKRNLLLKELMQQSIEFAIDERIADAILLSKLDGKDIELQFNPFSVDDKTNFICFRSNKSGIIKDIDLKKLREFADKLEKKANQSGYAFEAKQEKTSNDFSSDLQVKTPKQKTLIKNNKRYISRKFNDLIDEEHPNLIYIDKELVKGDENFVSELETIFKQIFTIEKTNSFTEEVRYELSNVKDQFTAAIKETATGEVEQLSKIYIVLAEGFLEQVLRCGGGYNYEQARKERTSLFAGWQEIQWLSSDLKDLMEQSIKTNDTKLIRSITYTPIAIARRAIEKHDHYIFQEFIRLPELMYFLSLKVDDKHTKEFLIDRSWRYIKELCDFYVEASLRKDDLSLEEIRSFKDFSIYFLFIFQNLMKIAFDNNDFETFQAFKKAALKLFEHSHLDRHHYYDAEHIEYELKQPNIDTEKKVALTKKLDITKEKDIVRKEISSRREQMLFGIASFILEALQKKSDDELLNKFFGDIHNSLPNDVKTFTDLFQQTHSFETEDFWGWSWWEQRPDDSVHSIRILEKLEKFYAVKSLMILGNKTDVDILKIELPTTRDFAFLAEGTRDLVKILDDIKQNPDRWGFVLKPEAISKVDIFKQLLNSAKNRQEENELEQKRKQPPSIKKIAEFERDVITNYHEQELILSIFNHLDLYKNKTDKKYEDKDKTRFGINTVDDKAAFFEDWYVHFGNWGENYGRNVASGVDWEILDKITDKTQAVKEEDIEQTIKGSGNIEDIFIIGTDTLTVRSLQNAEKFLPRWHKDAPQLNVRGFYGWFKYENNLIPIFEVHHKNPQKHIFILNKKQFGTLIQQSPLNEGENNEQLKDIFYFNIKAFSEDQKLMGEFISKPPEWLKAVGDTEKQKTHLAGRILIQIFLRFTIKWNNNFKGYKIKTSRLS